MSGEMGLTEMQVVLVEMQGEGGTLQNSSSQDEGIGLTIIKRILERHNRRIWMKS